MCAALSLNACPNPSGREPASARTIALQARSVTVYRRGLSDLIGYAKANPLAAVLPTRGQKEKVWHVWEGMLDYYMALESLRQYHGGFLDVEGRELRADSFAVYYASFLAQYRHALEFIELMEKNSSAHTILNESVPELGLEAGNYSAFKYRFLNIGIATEFGALEVISKTLDVSRLEELRRGIEEDSKAIWDMGRGRGEILTLRNALAIVRDTGLEAWLPIQRSVATWMGSVRVRRPDRFHITLAQIGSFLGRLEPGDIILQRREWYLSNVGLPGFWTHAALYVGTPEERDAFFHDEAVRGWVRGKGRESGDFEGLLRQDAGEAYEESIRSLEKGHVPRVVEAIAEGVVFTALEHSAEADSLAVLRPRLPKKEIAAALLRAFHYSGRPYDYNFDFMTDDKLVCSELIYKAYEPSRAGRGLSLPLVELAGRLVSPPNSMARLFDEEFDGEERQLDLVLFLDGQEREGRAVERSPEDFRRTWQRPKWHVLLQAER